MKATDRLRIEWHVWILDQRLYDLPRASRIARRRELRENLQIAAQDVGLRQALANLGNGRVLADEYLQAEFGNAPRASWTAAAVFLCTALLVCLSLLTEAVNAFSKGVVAGDPSATGTFHWQGVPYLQDSVTYTAVNGEITSVGGALTPLSYLLLFAGAVAIGRLWRMRPAFPWRTSSSATSSK
jgi:hypothetical protein